MSLINDALIKAERDRSDAAIAEAARLSPLDREQKRRAQSKRQSLGPIVANVAVVGVLFAAVIVLLLRPNVQQPDAVPAAPPAALIDRNEPVLLESPKDESSPFVPADSDHHAPAPSSPDYALAGMSALGDATLLSIVRRSDQRSVWIPVGKTVGEITAVSYDSDRDQAVIRVNGRSLTLSMSSGAAAE